MANPFGMKIQFGFGVYENEFDFKKPFEIDLHCDVETHQLEVKIWIRSIKRYPIQIDSPGFYVAKLKCDAIAGSFSNRIFEQNELISTGHFAEWMAASRPLLQFLTELNDHENEQIDVTRSRAWPVFGWRAGW